MKAMNRDMDNHREVLQELTKKNPQKVIPLLWDIIDKKDREIVALIADKNTEDVREGEIGRSCGNYEYARAHIDVGKGPGNCETCTSWKQYVGVVVIVKSGVFRVVAKFLFN